MSTPLSRIEPLRSDARVASRIGGIEVVCGPMFCGKSEELIRRLRRAAIARLAVVCVKPEIDVRYAVADVVSHAGQRLAARPVRTAQELLELRGEADVLGIDEVQFFSSDVVGVCEELAASGITVICAGLDRDYRGLPFGPMAELLCRADRVTKLQAVCVRCGADATLSQRLVGGAPAPFDDATVVVGGAERYEARCRGCFERG
jgi:thymidine kinase